MPAFRYGIICVGLFLTAQVALFIFTPALEFIDKNIYEPMSRLILHYFPLVPFVSAMALENIFSEKHIKRI